MKHRILIILFISTLFGILSFAPTYAESVNLKQSIVTLECFLEAVNAGNGSQLYVTPEDCQKDPIEIVNPITINSITITEKINQTEIDNKQGTTTYIPVSENYEEFYNLPNNEPTESNDTSIFNNLKKDSTTNIIVSLTISAVILWSLVKFYSKGKVKIK
jgi:hypothetical protein